jgi:hypothetical protein
MPYEHPMAVTMSILWWGIYLGCLGSSITLWFDLWTVRKDEAAAAREEPERRESSGQPNRDPQS